MNQPFDQHMKVWARMLNEDRFTPGPENPDEYKSDAIDIAGDAFEELQKDIESYFKKQDGSQKNMEGNLNESDDSLQTEAGMSPDQILAMGKEKDKAKVDGFVIKELETGDEFFTEPRAVVEVKFKDGRTDRQEIKFTFKQVLKAIEKLLKFKRVNKKVDQLSAEEVDTWAKDAITALVKGKFDPSSMQAWFYNNTSLDDWFAKEIDFQEFTDDRTAGSPFPSQKDDDKKDTDDKVGDKSDDNADDEDDEGEEADSDDKHSSDEDDEDISDFGDNSDDEEGMSSSEKDELRFGKTGPASHDNL